MRHLLAHTQGYNENREVDANTWLYVSRDGILDYVQLARLDEGETYSVTAGLLRRLHHPPTNCNAC